MMTWQGVVWKGSPGLGSGGVVSDPGGVGGGSGVGHHSTIPEASDGAAAGSLWIPRLRHAVSSCTLDWLSDYYAVVLDKGEASTSTKWQKTMTYSESWSIYIHGRLQVRCVYF